MNPMQQAYRINYISAAKKLKWLIENYLELEKNPYPFTTPSPEHGKNRMLMLMKHDQEQLMMWVRNIRQEYLVGKKRLSSLN